MADNQLTKLLRLATFPWRFVCRHYDMWLDESIPNTSHPDCKLITTRRKRNKTKRRRWVKRNQYDWP